MMGKAKNAEGKKNSQRQAKEVRNKKGDGGWLSE
jgi:hypothetical protein